MSYIEFRLKTSTFSGIPRNALRGLALCTRLHPPSYAVQFVADCIDIGNNTPGHHGPEMFPAFYKGDRIDADSKEMWRLLLLQHLLIAH
jgi:hypothetical protein